ncbi:Uncharacterized protein Rs2_41117 [Raphanus sativus]|nr:Uncharacterized protein Rs2_41117 [Raphanus sativus]
MTNFLRWIYLISDELRLREVRRELGGEEISGLKCSLGNLELSSTATSWQLLLMARPGRAKTADDLECADHGIRKSPTLDATSLFHYQILKVSGSGQSYSRTKEINNDFANEVSCDLSSTSSTQAPIQRPSERTYGAI